MTPSRSREYARSPSRGGDSGERGAAIGVGFYTPNYPGVSQDGGIGSHVRTLGHGLTGLGHRVAVLTPGDQPSVEEPQLHLHPMRLRHLPVADRLLPGIGACTRVAIAMLRLVRKYQLDVVEFPNWEGLGLLFRRLSWVPVVVRLYTSSLESQVIDQLPPTRLRRWDVRRERWQSHWADIVVTHSRAHRAAMAAECGLAEESIRIIPLGIRIDPTFRRRHSPEPFQTVVYLGRLEKRKGTIDLLQAIPAVLQRFPDTRFVLIGSDRAHCSRGRTHAEFVSEEFPAHVQRQVRFLGRLSDDEVDRWMQTADVFVAPSLYESFGLIFPEAMRWGTPVVGTRVGGIPEIITDGETGLLVQPQQPAELAAALIRLLGDRDLGQRLGSAGRAHVEKNFNVQRMTRATADLYSEARDQRRQSIGRRWSA